MPPQCRATFLDSQIMQETATRTDESRYAVLVAPKSEHEDLPQPELQRRPVLLHPRPYHKTASYTMACKTLHKPNLPATMECWDIGKPEHSIGSHES